MITIISGGQTGVDQAALRVAKELGFPTGGTAPYGWQTDEGRYPGLADFGLVASPFNGYRVRTRDNVRNADLTLWFGEESPGYRCTIGACQDYQKPYLINADARRIYDSIHTRQAQIVNVAGNRLRTNPQAAAQAILVLTDVLTRIRGEAQ